MSTDTTPTPLPFLSWTLNVGGNGNRIIIIDDQTRATIADCGKSCRENMDTASAIVQAVNERESLLAERDALRKVLEAAPDFGGEPKTAFGHEYRQWQAVAAKTLARAALAQGRDK